MGEVSRDDVPESGVDATPASGRVYATGMEIEPAPWTPPEVRPDLEPWAPYYGLRFSSPVRWGITCALLVAVLIWVAVAAVQLVLGEGRLRAVGVIMLMPMVVAAPLAMRVLRELWRPHR